MWKQNNIYISLMVLMSGRFLGWIFLLKKKVRYIFIIVMQKNGTLAPLFESSPALRGRSAAVLEANSRLNEVGLSGREGGSPSHCLLPFKRTISHLCFRMRCGEGRGHRDRCRQSNYSFFTSNLVEKWDVQSSRDNRALAVIRECAGIPALHSSVLCINLLLFFFTCFNFTVTNVAYFKARS